MGRCAGGELPRGRPGPPAAQRRSLAATRPAHSGRTEAGHLPPLEHPHLPEDPTREKPTFGKRTAAGGQVDRMYQPSRPTSGAPEAPPPRPIAHPIGARTRRRLPHAQATRQCGLAACRPGRTYNTQVSRPKSDGRAGPYLFCGELRASSSSEPPARATGSSSTPLPAWCRATPDIRMEPQTWTGRAYAAAQIPRHPPGLPRQGEPVALLRHQYSKACQQAP